MVSCLSCAVCLAYATHAAMLCIPGLGIYWYPCNQLGPSICSIHAITRTTNSHERWHNRIKTAADRKIKLNFYHLVELLHYQAYLVPLTWALLCQKKLKEHTTYAAGSTNRELIDLWQLYNSHDINLTQLHVLATEVIQSVCTQWFER